MLPSDAVAVIPVRPIGNLAAALALAQAEMAGAKKDTANTFYKSKYADLASVWEACRAPLSKNKLAVIQTTELAGDQLVLVTTLAHASGEFIQSYYPIRPVKDDPQGFGSAVTYARRYALAAIVGVAPEDDDGEAAMGRPGGQSGSQAAPAPQAKPRSLDAVVAKAKPQPPGLSDLWEGTPGQKLRTAIPVSMPLWNVWADGPLPDSSFAAKGHKTWREVSHGTPAGFRHKMLNEAVWYAKEQMAKGEAPTDFQQMCACALAVMEWLHSNKGPKSTTEPAPEDHKHPKAQAPAGELFAGAQP